MINLSRNAPIALVVGAAGFIGSHLVEKLLSSQIQVVGVDPYDSGNKENLNQATQNKNFHFFNQRFTNHLLDSLPKLNYGFFVISEQLNEHEYLSTLEQFLTSCRQFTDHPHKPKLVILSSVDLYNSKVKSRALKEAELRLAKFGKDEGFNVRVVRLANVYGPRMHFREEDPLNELIKLNLSDKLLKTSLSLDLTTRSIFIDDAVSLLLKTVLHGGTAQKIFDGALLHPVKISEIRQLLLDPLWHEKLHFTPTPLPAWPTPNLVKTQRELGWNPGTSMLKGLKQTLVYFKDNPKFMPEDSVIPSENVGEPRDLTQKSDGVKDPSTLVGMTEVEKKKGRGVSFDAKRLKSSFGLFLGLGVIFFGVLLPLVSLVMGGLSIRYHLQRSYLYLNQGDYSKAKAEAVSATEGVRGVDQFIDSMSLLSAAGLFNKEIESLNNLFASISMVTLAQQNTVDGFVSLQEALKVLSGESVKRGDLKEISTTFRSSSSLLGSSYAQLLSAEDENSFSLVKGNIADLRTKTLVFKQMADSGYSLSYLYPYLTEGKKEYLFLLSESSQVKEAAKVSLDQGTLKEIKEVSLPSLSFDGNLTEVDFATFAKSLAWLYSRSTNSQLDGVVMIDSSIITKTNQSALMPFLENLFYISSGNLLKYGAVVGEGLENKSLVIYHTNPHAFSYLTSLGYTGLFPRAAKQGAGERSEFLSLQLNPTSLAKKSLKLDDRIDGVGLLTHKLSVNMEKLDLDSELRLYLSAGTKLVSAHLGETNITQSVQSFSDYGWAGFSIKLAKSETPVMLTVEYQDALPLGFDENRVKYRVDIFKQISSGPDSLEYSLSIPENMKLQEGSTQFDLDLSKNRSLQVVISR